MTVQHPVGGGENQIRGNPRLIVESDAKKIRQDVGMESKGWTDSVHSGLGVVESLSEKLTFEPRLGSHKSDNQEPRPATARDVHASGTQEMQLSGSLASLEEASRSDAVRGGGQGRITGIIS